MAQNPKQKIDTGEIGNASTGDILFDGGEKINSNMDAIYDAFGDQRMSKTNTDEGNQTIHATGYWQKSDRTHFATPIEIGTMWNVDCSKGAVAPMLPKNAKVGEKISFINANGTVSPLLPLSISADTGAITGVAGQLIVTVPYCRVDLVCVSDTAGAIIWNYSVESMFGTKINPVEGTWTLSATPQVVRLGHLDDFNAMKLYVTCSSNDGSKMRQSEISILVDRLNKRVHNTEYAVMRIGNINEDDELIDLTFDVDQQNYIILKISSSLSNFKVAIKSLVIQRIGSV